MEGESERLRRRYAEEVRPHFKTQLWSTVHGWLCESEMFERLAEVGVPFVRSFEGAPIDGALICPGPITPPERPTTNLAVFEWALAQENVEFIPIEVKSVALHQGLGSNKNLDYTYSRPGQSKHGNAQVFFFRFEEFPDYTAIIPRAVFENSSGVAYGINGLISGVPCLWHPFMVHDSDLHAAVLSLLDQDTYYVNPTTGVRLTGFRPLRTKRPALTPIVPVSRRAMNVLRELFRQIESSAYDLMIDLNPIAPLVGDFVLNIPEVPELLCVEHKHFHWTDNTILNTFLDPERDDELKIRRSPYAKNRMWHFLIFQSSELPPRYICFARHEVDESWITDPPQIASLSESGKHIFQGDDATQKLLEKIKQQATSAIDTVHKVIENIRPHDSDIDSLIAGNHLESVLELLHRREEELESQIEEEQAFVAMEMMEEEEEEEEEEDQEQVSGTDDDNEERNDNVPYEYAKAKDRPKYVYQSGRKSYKLEERRKEAAYTIPEGMEPLPEMGRHIKIEDEE
ncbi:hypothetical protein KCU95_g2307, partial [Aureobasidium melanogenum]